MASEAALAALSSSSSTPDISLEVQLFSQFRSTLDAFIVSQKKYNFPTMHEAEKAIMTKLEGIKGELDVFLRDSARCAAHFTSTQLGTYLGLIHSFSEQLVLKVEKFDVVEKSGWFGSKEVTKTARGTEMTPLPLKNALTADRSGLISLLNDVLKQYTDSVSARREDQERQRKQREDAHISASRAEEEAKRKREDEERERLRKEAEEKRFKELEDRINANAARTDEALRKEKEAREEAESRLTSMSSALSTLSSRTGGKLLLQNVDPFVVEGLNRLFSTLATGHSAQQLMFESSVPVGNHGSASSAASAAVSSSSSLFSMNNGYVVPIDSENESSSRFEGFKTKYPNEYGRYRLGQCLSEARYRAICELVEQYNKFKSAGSSFTSYAEPPECNQIKDLIGNLLKNWNKTWQSSFDEFIKPKSSESFLSNFSTFPSYDDKLPGIFQDKDVSTSLANITGQGRFVPVDIKLAEEIRGLRESISTTNGSKAAPQSRNGFQ